MLARVLFVLLVGVPVCRGAKVTTGAAYPAYYEADGEVHNAHFYDSYNDEIRCPQKATTTIMEVITRLKRRDLENVRTLNPEEIIDVKGELNNILQREELKFLRGRRTVRDYTDSYDYLENSINVGPEVKAEQGLVPKERQPTDEVRQGSPTFGDQEYLDYSSSHATEQDWSFEYPPETTTYGKDDIVAEVKRMIPLSDGKVPRRSSIDYRKPTQEVQTWGTTEETEETEDTLMYPLKSTTYSNSDMQAEVRKLVQHWNSSSNVNTGENITYTNDLDKATWTATTLEPVTTTTVTTITATTTKTATTPPTNTKPTTTSQRMDIDAILAIISNLTYDYELNLTEQFNKTIIEHGVPTCPWEKWSPGAAWTAMAINDTTLLPWDFESSPVVSKCFVCGLRTPEIPRSAFCADAFAGDFLPLMPIDAQSRGKIAGFRKYCRYMDTQNYLENPDEPRAIYGRFTGGCAVRWTDLTGVYTQRTCRSRFRPLMGKHFASKRMAKLELALVNVENGCIVSPMATLLPVSRGISLYARFHACVCSTNWCNRATLEQASFNTLATIVLAYWLVHYP